MKWNTTIRIKIKKKSKIKKTLKKRKNKFKWISLDFIGFHILPTKIRAKKEKEIKMKKIKK